MASMSTPVTYIWIILALCVAKGSSEVLYVESGQDVTMNCGDAVEKYGVEWKHNDNLILRIDAKSGRKMKGMCAVAAKAKITGTNMLITSLGANDAGVYSCTGYKDKFTKSTWQHTLNIVSVIARPANVVLDSTELNLTCDITKNSTAKVQWLRPPNLKPFGEHNKIVTLKSVTLADAGEWACQIKHEEGEELKIKVYITVVGPLMSTEEIKVIPGATAELPCSLPHPSLLTVIGGGWVRDPPNATEFLTLETQGKNLHWRSSSIGSRIILSDKHPRTNFGVKLTNVQSADTGVYMCTLMFQGEKNLSATLKLKVEDEGSAVVLDPLEITAQSGGTAELPCSHPGANHPHVVGGGWTHEPQDYLRLPILMTTESKGLQWNGTDVLASKVTFSDKHLSMNFNMTLHNVESVDAGVYVCTLVFEDGKILNTKLNLKVEGENVHVAHGFWQWPVLGVALWVWLAAAGGLILMIGLVIVIVLIQKRHRKHKNKHMKQKKQKTKVSTTKTQELLLIQHKTERQPHPGRRERPAPLSKTQYYGNVM